ncbi:MAG: hypothetical protein NVS3B26_22780 [Mycobacteriales bacterium]
MIGPDGLPVPKGHRLIGPYGEKLSSGALEVEPEELPWLIRMLEWIADEGLSIDQVTGRLTEAGVPTENGGKKDWSRSSVKGIITNQCSWARASTDTRKSCGSRREADPGRARPGRP